MTCNLILVGSGVGDVGRRIELILLKLCRHLLVQEGFRLSQFVPWSRLRWFSSLIMKRAIRIVSPSDLQGSTMLLLFFTKDF